MFENKIKLEKNLVNPGLTLSAGMNQDPGIRNYTIGSVSRYPFGIKEKVKLAKLQQT